MIPQAFKRWIPSLTDDSINVILTTKGCGSFRLVNIISYDLLVKMSKEVQAKRFMAVIAVREIALPISPSPILFKFISIRI